MRLNPEARGKVRKMATRYTGRISFAAARSAAEPETSRQPEPAASTTQEMVVLVVARQTRVWTST
jgi:hypothetical protein